MGYDFGGLDFGLDNIKIGNLDLNNGTIELNDEVIESINNPNFKNTITPDLNLKKLKFELFISKYKFAILGLVLLGGYLIIKKK
jgi:hypothetical protein